MASIPIQDVSNYKQYFAAASQTVFTYPFVIFDENDIKVYSRLPTSPGDDTTDILIIALDYTVTGVGNALGGTVILTTPAIAGNVVTLVRREPMERLTNFVQSFTADEVNLELNSQILLDQQNREDILARSTRYQDSSTITEDDANLPVLGATEVWRKDAAGITIQGFPIDITNPPPDLAIFIALLASNGVGEGASLVGFNPAGTVQDAIDTNIADIASVTTDLSDHITEVQSTAINEGAATIGTDDGFLNVQVSLNQIRGIATGQSALPYGMGSNYINSTTFEIQPGSITATDMDVHIILTSPFQKSYTAPWTPAVGQPGLVQGATPGANKSFFVFSISKADGAVDMAIDDNFAGTKVLVDPTVIANNFIHKQLIWSFKSASVATDLRPWSRFQNFYTYIDGTNIVNGTVSVGEFYNSLIPAQTEGHFNFVSAAASSHKIYIRDELDGLNPASFTTYGRSAGGTHVPLRFPLPMKGDRILIANGEGGGAASWTNTQISVWGYEYKGEIL